MRTDLNDLPVVLSGEESLSAWNELQRAYLAHSAATPGLLGRVLAAEPDFALGHAVKGLFYLLMGRSELRDTAAVALQAAERGEGDARSEAYVSALRLALSGRLRLAADALDAILRGAPRDALAMKLTHAIRFILGDSAGMRASLERIAPAWGDHPLRGYMMGCTAFALEETGDYAEAEAVGRAGLDLAEDDAWGLHAVAHVQDMTGRAGEGVLWLANRSGQWAHCNNFGFHVWWHLALFHIDRGEPLAALELYDAKVRPEPTDDFRDIANAASLLLRLECEGVETGGRWAELADRAAARIHDGALVFADLHYQLALVRTGRIAEAEALAERLAASAGTLAHDQHEVAALSGLAMARGLLSFREGAYAGALPDLCAGLDELARIGGSHAQRDVFHRIAIEAALMAGKPCLAETLLAARGARRGGSDGYAGRIAARIAERRSALDLAGLAAE